MKYVKLLVCGLLTVVVYGCGSDDSANNANTVGGTPNLGGSTGTDVPGATGGNNPGTANVAVGGTTGVPNGGTTSSANAKITINEVVPSNQSGAIDEAGAYPDWVELYNSTAEAISLSGFTLTDNVDEPAKAVLDPSLTIPAGGVLVLWADGDVDQSVLHLPFKLAATGEGLYLFDAEQKQVDSVEWGAASPNQAYSRIPDGTGAFVWCSTPTPNKTNGSACGS